MRYGCVWPASLCVTLLMAGIAFGQAGRYIPAPRLPGGGGGHVPFVPHHGDSSSEVFWVILAILGVIGIGFIGWHLGAALAGGKRPLATPAPSDEDLILGPSEVEDKLEQTTRLLETLARRDAVFSRPALHKFILSMFTQVQDCWAKRDYDPIRDCLAPSLLAEHEALLREMRENREVNRIEDLHVLRLEFVHAGSCPEDPSGDQVAALITFEARVYFVSEQTGAYLRGPRKLRRFQEFWTFRRRGDLWILHAIDQTRKFEHPDAVPHVARVESSPVWARQ